MTVAKALDKKRLWREIEREERRKARAKLVGLRGSIREARRQRKEALVAAKERCRAERLAFESWCNSVSYRRVALRCY